MSNPDYILHNYFRSSTSVRVRVALNLKGLDYEYKAYALLPNEHKSKDYLAQNPQGLVPALEIGTPPALSQSIAIMEYLDEVHPVPPLLPGDFLGRARARALSQIIGCDIHPINNLRILRYIRSAFGADDDAVRDWFQHWVADGFVPLEQRLADEPETGEFCHGDTPGLADICLFAQVLNNGRFGVDMTPYPTINRIHENCLEVQAFKDAMPANQPDAT